MTNTQDDKPNIVRVERDEVTILSVERENEVAKGVYKDNGNYFFKVTFDKADTTIFLATEIHGDYMWIIAVDEIDAWRKAQERIKKAQERVIKSEGRGDLYVYTR